MNFRYLSTLCLLWTATLGLLGCGGGGGNDAKTLSEPLLVLPGVFWGTAADKEFIGIITPASQWYGLHYLAEPSFSDPDIYSGSLNGLGKENAAVSGLRYFQLSTVYNNVFTGSGAFTSPGSSKLSGEINFNGIAKQKTSFVASQNNYYNFTQASRLGDIANTWIGRLSYGEGSASSFAFTVSPTTGVINDSASFGLALDCKWISPSTAAINSEGNIFMLELTMADATSCGFKKQKLTGVAIVQASPVAGKTQRLIWVATTPTGQGMSFKADR